MNELSEFFKTYGESLATRLVGIGHSEVHKAFVFVEDAGDPSEVIAFTTNGKAPAGQPVLIWEDFEEDLATSGRDNYHSQIQASLAVINKATERTGKRAAYQTGRDLVLKAIALMIQDAQDGVLEELGIQVDVSKMPCQKIGPISASWYGYGVQFSWTVPLDLNLDPGDVVIA